MAYTLPELREELQALGYGGVPDHLIVSSLSQLKLDIPPSSYDEKDWKDRSPPRRGVRIGKSSREVHGSPVPGDREFAQSKKFTAIRKGLDAVCFTPDFATEVDEMRKMLRVMQGTKEELFGSVCKSTGKRMGLADEHEQYVGNLMDQWREVGRTLRTKRCGYPVVAGDISACTNEVPNSETRTYPLQKEDAVLENQLPPSAVSETSSELEAQIDSEGCKIQGGNANSCDDGVHVGERVEGDGENAENGPLGECLTGRVERENHEKGVATVGDSTNSKVGELNSSQSEKAVHGERNDKGLAFTRQEGSSTISPGASYKQGGMLYPEIFTDRYKHSGLHSNGEVLPFHQDPEENPLPSPPSSACTPKDVLDKLSALSNDQFLAAFEKSLDGLDPQDTIDQETFANVNQRITETTPHSHVNFFSQAVRSVESENPLELSVPVLRTPDRRGGGHQSPLNDRSNIRIAEDTVVPRPSEKAVFKITDFNSGITFRRKSAVSLKRSQSSRDARGSERVEANGAHLSDITEDRLDSRFSVKTTPPPSGRKIKAEKVLRHSSSEKSSPSISRRNDSDSDVSHLDIASLVLSPIKVREPASPLKLYGRERSCVANELPEHRQGTCTVCPPHVRKSRDSSKSPFRNDFDSVSSGTEASPKQKLPLRKFVGSSPKQKLPLRKGSGPSGIYTPLLDQKKNDITSKVLLKTSRLASSMDFGSESSRDLRAPSLRSSTESSRSSGTQRAPSSQSSKGNFASSPYAKSSSFNSLFGSRSSTPKDTLTPGGPRRAGKVDRVARFAEMQNLWKNDKFLKTSSKRKPQSFHRIFARLHLSHERYTAAYRERRGRSYSCVMMVVGRRVLEDMRPRSEPAPFVVPALYSTAERVKTDQSFLFS